MAGWGGAAAPWERAPTDVAPVRVTGFTRQPLSGSGPSGASTPPAGAKTAAGANPYPWGPPAALAPPPAGTYNPEYDTSIETGKAQYGQAQTEAQRHLENENTNYSTKISLSQEKEKETLARLAESYKKLAGKQNEQGNATGTLYGGALIAAATKRAANEGVAKAHDELAAQNERGSLTNAHEQAAAALAEALKNAQSNERLYTSQEEKLRGDEAASKYGWSPPVGPSVVPTGQFIRSALGSVRVGGAPGPYKGSPAERAAVERKQGF